jgi:sulfate permease, SulP family
MTTINRVNNTKPRPDPPLRLLPILGWKSQYDRAWLRADFIAGLTIVALLIPEGMAYAQIAGVPPQAAFYATPIGLLLFAAFGSSRQLVVAVSAAFATMSFVTVRLIAQPKTPEFVVLTAANVGAGFFQGFPIGSSLSKSAADDQAGAHSQLSGIVAAAVTAIVALLFTHWFYALPEATLGAIVVVAVLGMIKIGKLKHLYHARRADFMLAVVALLAALTFETLQALLIAVVISLFALIWRASHPRLAVLGLVPDRLDFSDVRRHPENKTLPDLLMARSLLRTCLSTPPVEHQAAVAAIADDLDREIKRIEL